MHDVLGGDVTATRWLLVGLLVLAAAATVAGQLLARHNAGNPDSDSGSGQRLHRGVLVVVPVVTIATELLLDFPLGVALYLLTTSVWTLGQQVVAALAARAGMDSDTRATEEDSRHAP